MKWWEKTVEYTFVMRALQKELFDLFLPLDGDVESIGDTVVCKDSEFFIVEFKKSLSDLSGEYSKYNNEKIGYLLAAETMKQDPSSQAHFLVGGKAVEGQKYLSIEIIRYFETEIDNPTNDIAVILEKGITLEELKEYTKKVTSWKKSEDSEGTSSGGFTYQSVLAVSKSNKSGALIPLHYFKPPAPKKELKKNLSHSSTPSMGRF